MRLSLLRRRWRVQDLIQEAKMAWWCGFNVKGASTLSCSVCVFASVSSTKDASSVCLFCLSRPEVTMYAAKGVTVCKSTFPKSNTNVRSKLLRATLFFGGRRRSSDIDTHDSNCSRNASRGLASSHLLIIIYGRRSKHI